MAWLADSRMLRNLWWKGKEDSW